MASYYVKNGGNDSSDGLTDGTAWAHHPWMSGWTAGAKSLSPGDIVYLNKGDEWYDVITVAQSGTTGNPITISAYGTGDNPILTGFTTLSGWTSEGSNIYSKVITSASQTNCVSVDSVNTGMGKTPDADLGRSSWYRRTGWSYLTDYTGTVTDTGIGDSPDWAGAEIVFMTVQWSWQTGLITDHTGDVFTYSSTDIVASAYAGDYGYFIQNDLRCVTTTNEWYHDYASTGKFYIYGDPSTKVVKVATKNYLIVGGAYDYITIENITLEGAIYDAIQFGSGSNYILIQDSTISFTGQFGINISQSNYSNVENCIIHDIGNAGIWCSGSTGNELLDNTIYNISLIYGQANRGVYCTGIMFSYITNGLIQYNTIYNCGLNGMQATGNGSEIRNNYIYDVCLRLSDGGALYYPGGTVVTGLIFNGNIVRDVLGNLDPSPVGNPIARGIYLDDTPVGVTVTNNTTINCGESGLMMWNGSYCVFTGNTAYGNENQQLFIQNSNIGACHDNTITYNILFSKNTAEYTVFISYESTTFGTSDYNYFARPINELTDDNTIRYYSTGYYNVDLATWKTYSSKDTNSNVNLGGAVDNIDKLHVIYNATKVNKYYLLSASMKDVANTSYSGTITLEPWESLVLIGEGTVTETSGEIVHKYLTRCSII